MPDTLATKSPPSPEIPLLSLVDLTKTYGIEVAVQKTSLSVRDGELMTFLGPSGSRNGTSNMATSASRRFAPDRSGRTRSSG